MGESPRSGNYKDGFPFVDADGDVHLNGTTVWFEDAEAGDDNSLGGGGSAAGAVRTLKFTTNAVHKDFDSDGAAIIMLDPRAQDWEAEAEYQASDIGDMGTGYASFVHAVDDDTTTFECSVIANGTTGLVEPTWDTMGGTTDDGNFCYQAAVPIEIGWTAETEYGTGSELVVAGSHWYVSDFVPHTSGLVEPNWASGPNQGDTVADDGFDWVNLGPTYAWQAETVYGYNVTAAGDSTYVDMVLPTTPNGFGFKFNYREARSALSGSMEPTWDTASGHFTLDGELVWVETSNSERLVLTGIKELGYPAVILIANAVPSNDGDNSGKKIVLKDATNSVGADMDSDAANRINNDTNDLDVDAGESVKLIYTDDQWHVLRDASL